MTALTINYPTDQLSNYQTVDYRTTRLMAIQLPD